MMRLVVEAYRYHASGASSGGEGMARMEDVRSAEQKLATFTTLAFDCPKCSGAIEFPSDAADSATSTCACCHLRFGLAELRQMLG